MTVEWGGKPVHPSSPTPVERRSTRGGAGRQLALPQRLRCCAMGLDEPRAANWRCSSLPCKDETCTTGVPPPSDC
jgi:hypothetical protein